MGSPSAVGGMRGGMWWVGEWGGGRGRVRDRDRAGDWGWDWERGRGRSKERVFLERDFLSSER